MLMEMNPRSDCNGRCEKRKSSKGDLAPEEVRGNNQIKSKIAKSRARHAEEKFPTHV